MKWQLPLVLILSGAVIGVSAVKLYDRKIKEHNWDLDTRPMDEYYFEVLQDKRKIPFNLLDPALAPPAKRELVQLGYNIMLNTAEHAEKYVGNKLACINCHFCAGNTTGGRNGSISLVGVTTRYPQYSERDHATITLADRIENCFVRSMNGKLVPEDSKEMKAILTYLAWISHDVKDFKQLPWLGLRQLHSSHQPNALEGGKVYTQHCAVCHGKEGQGSDTAPPVWGDGSFNDGAGMNTQSRLSAFVYDNMPFQEPGLTVEEALDVAAFIISQPRPHFIPPVKH